MNRLPLQSICLLLAAACGPVAEPVTQTQVTGAARVSAGSQVRDLGNLGGSFAIATDINDEGVVVGYSQTASGQNRAFRWTAAGGMKALPILPGGQQSSAARILNSGQILGSSQSGGPRSLAVSWSPDGRIQVLPVTRIPEAATMLATDFNGRGEVVGGAFSSSEHGWYWTRESGTIDLSIRIPSCLENFAAAINASGQVAGVYCAPSIGWLHPFRWSLQGGFRELKMAGDAFRANASGTAINDAGTVAGWMDPRGNTSGFATTWSATGNYTLLPSLASAFPASAANDIDNQGVVVGWSLDDATGGPVPVAWPTPTSLLRLDATGMQFAFATAINDAGLIVGWGVGNGGDVRALIWRLSEGQAASELSPGGVGPARDAVRPVWSGPAACLNDRRAMASKPALAECVRRAVGR